MLSPTAAEQLPLQAGSLALSAQGASSSASQQSSKTSTAMQQPLVLTDSLDSAMHQQPDLNIAILHDPAPAASQESQYLSARSSSGDVTQPLPPVGPLDQAEKLLAAVFLLGISVGLHSRD